MPADHQLILQQAWLSNAKLLAFDEIDFVLAEVEAVTDLIEVKFSDATPGAYRYRMAERFAPARAVQIVAELRQVAQHGRIEVANADEWLAGLAA